MTGIAIGGDTGAATAAAQPTTGTTTTTQPPPVSVAATSSTGSGATTTTTGTSDWRATIEDAELRGLAEKKGWGSQADALRSYSELERAFSAKQTTTSAPATPQDYKFDTPDKLPDGLAYDSQFENAFRTWAHKAGISQDAAKVFQAEYLKYVTEAHSTSQAAQVAATTERVAKAAAELETLLGAKQGTPGFTRQMEMAKRAMRLADPKGDLGPALKEAGVIVTVGGQDMVANPAIFALLSKMGNGMYAEDALFGQPTGNTNPFDPKTEDMKQQGWLVRNDPEKAKMLIRAAGPEATKNFRHFLDKKK